MPHGTGPFRVPPKRADRRLLMRILQFATDVLVLNVTYHLLLLIRFGAFFADNPSRLRGAPWSIYPELEIVMNVLWVIIAVFLQVYRPEHRSEDVEHPFGGLNRIRLAGRAGLLLTGSLLVFIVAQGGYDYYSRTFLAVYLASIPIVLIILRIVEKTAAATVRRQTLPRKNVVVIGTGATGTRFCNIVSANPNYGYRVLGFLDNPSSPNRFSHNVLGTIHDFTRIVTRENVDEIVIALPDSDEATLSNLLHECENRCIRVAFISEDNISYDALPPQSIEHVGELSLVRLRGAPLDEWSNRMIKRSFDVAFSLLVLTFIFPIVFLISAILIKLTSHGPIFFTQARTGKDGQTFLCYKFRTMRVDSSAHSQQALRNDPRLTRIGRILRRTSLDELPQFWNVLKNEMSIIGPRPHMLKHTEDYRKIITQYMARHFVKPGISGWAQVNGYRGSTDNPEAMQQRIGHDLYYIEHWSFLFDLTIVGRTVILVFLGDKNAY